MKTYMNIHPLQKKLLKILTEVDISKMTLREIAVLVEETHPQKIQHHLKQLEKKGYIEINKETGEVRPTKAMNSKDDIVAVPIYGSADCGEANIFAEENLEGYLKISRSLIGAIKNVFAIQAKGLSMNKAKVNGKYSIEEGDFVLVDPNNQNPQNGDYVLSVINGCANIKRFFFDRKQEQIALMSESSEKFPPIIIHQDDKFIINGVVKNVIKNFFSKHWEEMQNAAGKDTLDAIGSISKDEADFYHKLK